MAAGSSQVWIGVSTYIAGGGALIGAVSAYRSSRRRDRTDESRGAVDGFQKLSVEQAAEREYLRSEVRHQRETIQLYREAIALRDEMLTAHDLPVPDLDVP